MDLLSVFVFVMAALVPAVHVSLQRQKDVDAGHIGGAR